MSRFIARLIGAAFVVLGGPLWADIPMVTTPMILPVARVIPHFPEPEIQDFNGVTQVAVRAGEDVVERIDVHPQADVSAFGFPCDISVKTVPVGGAMLGLQVYAPCKPHASVHVSHGGLHYEAQVSLTGRAEMTFPAMTRDAQIFVAVDEDVFERQVEVTDVDHFARVALVGVLGDVPKLLARGLASPMDIYDSRGVQVFSVDLREVADSMTYRLTLRQEVTAQNCDHPVQAYLRRILPGQGEKQQVLRLAAQDCSRIGDILELKNIVPDLKLASN